MRSPIEPSLIGIGTRPTFAIGQRALLVCTAHGNVLWDCISLIDEATVTLIKGLGGLSAIAISHPHFYTTLVEWSGAFGNAPVHLHAGVILHPRMPRASERSWAVPATALRPWPTGPDIRIALRSQVYGIPDRVAALSVASQARTGAVVPESGGHERRRPFVRFPRRSGHRDASD